MTFRAQLLVLAKTPTAGRVKTRLCPSYTPVQAAAIAAAALTDTLAAVAATPVARRVLVLDGDPPAGTPAGFDVVRQRGGGLDERLAAAFCDTYAGCALPMLLVGMDTPQADVALLTAAVRTLLRRDVDAVLGPATDGGFWLLGLRRPDRRLLVGVPMSTGCTGAAQRARLAAAGLRVATLPTRTDVDTAATAARVAADAPWTRFAALVRTLRAQGAG